MTTLQFCTKFGKLTVQQKADSIKKLQNVLTTGKSERGTIMKPDERKAVEQLTRWCNVNMMVGDELCPASNLHQY